jgi:tetraacyldisaccharide 4'-kinase
MTGVRRPSPGAPTPSPDASPNRHGHWHWQARLTQAWLRRGPLAYLLWPLSVVYGALVRLRFTAYRWRVLPTARLPVPVVVVGNVVVGGAGKTPTVIALVQHLLRHGHRPGVVSRGHGRRPLDSSGRLEHVLAVLPDTPAPVSGDEPALIARATGVPVYVGTSRLDAGRALLAAHPDTTVLVCDDGLQHMALKADVAIAVFDERGVGNGWLLPAGMLREPWPRSVGRRLDMVLHIATRPHGTHAPAQPTQPLPTALPRPSGVTRFVAEKKLADHARSIDGQRIPLRHLPKEGLTALAGIARPAAFFSMLRDAGINLQRTLPLADHQDFRAWIQSTAAQADLTSWLETGLVCTEKDAVKLFPLLQQQEQPHRLLRVWCVPLAVVPEPEFFAAVHKKLSSFDGQKTA